MADGKTNVWVIDDDDGMRKSLRLMLADAGHEVRVAAAPHEFFEAYKPSRAECLILDLNLPEMNGLQLIAELRSQGIHIPVIMLTGYGSVPQAVRAMKLGVVDFLEKPAERDLLLQRVRQALQQSTQTQAQLGELYGIQQRIALLTPRERELLDMIVSGKSNKQIAAELYISEKTVANHRARLMEKMEALNAADLARMVVAARDYRQVAG